MAKIQSNDRFGFIIYYEHGGGISSQQDRVGLGSSAASGSGPKVEGAAPGSGAKVQSRATLLWGLAPVRPECNCSQKLRESYFSLRAICHCDKWLLLYLYLKTDIRIN